MILTLMFESDSVSVIAIQVEEYQNVKQTGELTAATMEGDFDFLNGMLCVLRGKENLISVSHECHFGMTVVFTSSGVKVYDSADVSIDRYVSGVIDLDNRGG
jgi:hypothetical protein